MNTLLDRSLFFVREHVRVLKATNKYDVFDPSSEEKIMHCQESPIGFFAKLFRFTNFRIITPFNIHITSADGSQRICRVQRKWTLWNAGVNVYDEKDVLIARFKSAVFSFVPKFDILSPEGEKLCQLKGKFWGWRFRFIKDSVEFDQITRKWAGIGKELFTSANNYMISINENVPLQNNIRTIILGGSICIDMLVSNKPK